MQFFYGTAHVIFISLILDTVNGFSFHPYLPLATTSSGHRRFGMQDEFEEESSLAGVCQFSRLQAFVMCLYCLNGRCYTLIYYLFCTFRRWELLLCLEVFLFTRSLKQHQALSCGGTGEHFGVQMLEVHGVMRSGYSCGRARTGCRPLKRALYWWVIREFAGLSCSRQTTCRAG